MPLRARAGPAGGGANGRAHHAKGGDQGNGDEGQWHDGAAREVDQPGLLPQRLFHGLGLVDDEGRGDQLDRVAPVGIAANGFLTSLVRRSSSAWGRAAVVLFALGVGGGAVVDDDGGRQALDGADGVARHAHGLVHLVVGDLLAPAVGVATAAIGGLQRAAGGVDGAVAGTGGWLLAAPGTPVGWAGLALFCSLVWLLRTVAVALAPWLGRYSSAVLSTWEKSMSALTVLRRLSRPTTGSSRSKMRLL